MGRLALLVAALLAACSEPLPLARPPTAFAGFDRVAEVGEEVVLEASGSTSPSGLRLGFTWRLEAQPRGSTAQLEGRTAREARLFPDLPGHYVVSLTVSDGALGDRDLVGITALAAEAGPTDLRLTLSPATCPADLGALEGSPCGFGGGELAIVPEAPAGAAVRWSFLRLPPGVTEAELEAHQPAGPSGPLAFTPPRPGDYWVTARAEGPSALGPASAASVAVFGEGPAAADRALPRIQAAVRARAGSRVLFDGRSSTIPTSSSAARLERSWALITSPSSTDALSSTATGCAPDECRVLIPSVRGTYLVGLRITVGGVPGPTALHALEVD